MGSHTVEQISLANFREFYNLQNDHVTLPPDSIKKMYYCTPF